MSRAALTDYVAALMWQGQEPCNWFWGGTGDHWLTARHDTGIFSAGHPLWRKLFFAFAQLRG